MKIVTSQFIKVAHRSMVSALVFVVLVSCLGCAGNPTKPPGPYTPEELGEFPVHPELEPTAPEFEWQRIWMPMRV